MKKDNDPFMKLRIILASIFLTIILGGWVIYGFIFLDTNPARVLTKLANNEKEILNKYIDKIDFKKENNYAIILDKDKKIYIHSDFSKNKLYIYNDTKYYSFTNISNDSNSYKKIINSFLDSFTRNYKILNINKKKDSEKDYYVYSYSLNELYPLISTLKTDKIFIDTLKNSFKLNDQQIIDSLDKYSSNSIGLNIITKGSKRDIAYYNLKIDNLFNIFKEGDYINGFFLNYGFSYDKELIIYSEKNEYHAQIKKEDKSFSEKDYQEGSLEEVLSIIE